MVLSDPLRRVLRDPEKSPTGLLLPSEIPGLKIWPRFNQGITTDAFGITQWDDASGNGNHIVQTVDANKPSLAGDGSVITDGATEFLKAVGFTWNQPETVYLLLRTLSETAGDRLFDGNTLNSGAVFDNASDTLSAYAGAQINSPADWSDNVYHILCAVFNGASSFISIDNNAGTTGNAGAANMSGFTLGAHGGAGSYAHAQYKEAIGYDGAHDAATRAKVIEYLAGVGGLSI